MTVDERKFFASSNPLGFILFKRNCESADQVRTLVRELRFTVGRDDAPVFIDQEGGRVARLQPPVWAKYPPMHLFGMAYENDPVGAAEAMRLCSRLIAHDLTQLGVTVNCAPVLDLFMADATSAIGDRAISRKPAVVAELARLQAETFLANGIIPVIKHLPGHGRMKADPHVATALVDATVAVLESDDFVPFELLKDLPVGMNSHGVFSAIDPNNPATLSSTVQQETIRNRLGFDGLLLSDDIDMRALKGEAGELARRVQEAGSDIILHCNGKLDEMKAVATAVEPMSDEVWERWQRACSMVSPADPAYNPREDIARLDILLGGMAYEGKSWV